MNQSSAEHDRRLAKKLMFIPVAVFVLVVFSSTAIWPIVTDIWRSYFTTTRMSAVSRGFTWVELTLAGSYPLFLLAGWYFRRRAKRTIS